MSTTKLQIICNRIVALLASTQSLRAKRGTPGKARKRLDTHLALLLSNSVDRESISIQSTTLLLAGLLRLQ